jgi:hypothetical protein
MYADESGSTGINYENEEQPIFVLGAILVKDSNWQNINKYFNEEKKKICSLLETSEIHTNEIFSPTRKSPFYKINWEKNLATLEALSNLILSLDIKFFHVVIDKKWYKNTVEQLKDDSYLKIDPYLIAYVKLQETISNYIYKLPNNDNGLIFLDEFLSLDKEIPEISSLLINENICKENIIENAIFLKSSSSNFIQIADFYAFYINKYYMLSKGYKQYNNEKKQNHCMNMGAKFFKNTEELFILDKIK